MLKPSCGHWRTRLIPDVCRRCNLALHDSRYNRKYGGDGVVTAGKKWVPRSKRGPCVYLGEPTGERKLCETCAGRVELKMFRCGHSAHPDPITLRDCRDCGDHEAR